MCSNDRAGCNKGFKLVFGAKPRSQLKKVFIRLLPDHRNTQTFFFGTPKAPALSLSARACQD